jgi:hypothetical protein
MFAFIELYQFRTYISTLFYSYDDVPTKLERLLLIFNFDYSSLSIFYLL